MPWWRSIAAQQSTLAPRISQVDATHEQQWYPVADPPPGCRKGVVRDSNLVAALGEIANSSQPGHMICSLPSRPCASHKSGGSISEGVPQSSWPIEDARLSPRTHGVTAQLSTITSLIRRGGSRRIDKSAITLDCEFPVGFQVRWHGFGDPHAGRLGLLIGHYAQPRLISAEAIEAVSSRTSLTYPPDSQSSPSPSHQLHDKYRYD
jgi:hypothetical protein